jgi:hypothetical protein
MKSPKIDHFVQGEFKCGHISRTTQPIKLRFLVFFLTLLGLSTVKISAKLVTSIEQRWS